MITALQPGNPTAAAEPARTTGARTRLQRIAFGHQPRWVRPSAAGLLLATAFLYLWNLAASGYANSFYAAAIQAGTKDWTALFFGSLDAGNAITVDKPPASLWIPALAGRIFGFSPASMLVPEALMGGCRRRAPVLDGEAGCRPRSRPACRRGARTDPGGGADVPFQQP
ncbi:hypothetical protein AAHB33_03615 [Paenarthrobacter sp. S56]|uniref:hypothetical protein n=1 Tax=Paenarthrobacter sp. S56 TaxID=3138179 RepID=UPI00321A7E79